MLNCSLAIASNNMLMKEILSVHVNYILTIFIACFYSCKTCVAHSLAQCLSCYDDRTLDNTMCNCNIYTYENSDTLTCEGYPISNIYFSSLQLYM